MAKEVVTTNGGKTVKNLPLKMDGEYLAGCFIVPMVHGLCPALIGGMLWGIIQSIIQEYPTTIAIPLQGFLAVYIPLVVFGIIASFFTPTTYMSAISGESNLRHLKLKNKADGDYQTVGPLPVILTDGRITTQGNAGNETIEDKNGEELIMPTHFLKETVSLKNGKPLIQQTIEEAPLYQWDKAFNGTVELGSLAVEKGRGNNVNISEEGR